MKKIIFPASIFVFSACLRGPLKPAGPAANFEFSAYEVVETPAEDAREFVAVLVDGQEKGRTPVAPKSQLKSWRAELPAGNYPMRFEVWDSTDGISGARRPDELQPRERFIRIEPGQKTVVVLKFYDKGRQNYLYITRE